MGLQPEQSWNIRVSVARGNVITLFPRDAGTRRLPEAVHRLLGDESIRRVAGEVHLE